MVSDTHCSVVFLSFFSFLSSFFFCLFPWEAGMVPEQTYKFIMVSLCYVRTKRCRVFYLFTSQTSQSFYTMKAWKYIYRILITIRTDGRPSWLQIFSNLPQPSLEIAKAMCLLLTAGDVIPSNICFE